MRVDYDKDMLASLIRHAGGDLRLVEKALFDASRDKQSPFVSEAEVRAAIDRKRGDDQPHDAPPAPPPGE